MPKLSTIKKTSGKKTNPKTSKKSSKKINKKIPSSPAKDHKLNTVKKGLDGNMWIVSKRSDGVKIWKRKNNKKKSVKKRGTNTSKKSLQKGGTMVEFVIRDLGGNSEIVRLNLAPNIPNSIVLHQDKFSSPNNLTLDITYTEEDEEPPNQLVHPDADGNIRHVDISYLEYIRHEMMNGRMHPDGVIGANLDDEAVREGKFLFSYSNFITTIPLLRKVWELAQWPPYYQRLELQHVALLSPLTKGTGAVPAADHNRRFPAQRRRRRDRASQPASLRRTYHQSKKSLQKGGILVEFLIRDLKGNSEIVRLNLSKKIIDSMVLHRDKLRPPNYFTLYINYTEEEAEPPNQLVDPDADGNILNVDPSYLVYIKNEMMNGRMHPDGVIGANLDDEAVREGKFLFSYSNFTAEVRLLSGASEVARWPPFWREINNLQRRAEVRNGIFGALPSAPNPFDPKAPEADHDLYYRDVIESRIKP